MEFLGKKGDTLINKLIGPNIDEALNPCLGSKQWE